MGKTIKISKSKNLLFKKLSFLYLVFILFLFLTSPGEYVNHYPPLSKTQEQLNQILLDRLKEAPVENENQESYKLATLNFVGEVDNIVQNFNSYAEEVYMQGFNLKENNYAEKEISRGEIAIQLETILNTLAEASPESERAALEEDLLNPIGFQNQQFDNITYYFHETPNGAVPSILQHFKTVALFHCLQNISTDAGQANIVAIENISGADFVQRFRNTLLLGQDLDINFRRNNPTIHPIVRISQKEVALEQLDSLNYQMTYRPASPGNYFVEITIDDKIFVSNLKVLTPQIEFIGESDDPFTVTVGVEREYSLNTKRLPSLNSLSFKSNNGDVIIEGNKLKIIPHQQGKFSLTVSRDDKVLDELEMFARKPGMVNVAVRGSAGDTTGIGNASYLVPEDGFWQVVAFKLTVINPDGSSTTHHNNTRYFNRASLESCQKAEKGSVFILDDISLISSKGGETTKAKPLLIRI